jgi:hypothetical protein
MLSLLVTLIIGAGGASDEVLIPGRDSGYFGLPPQVACDSKVTDGKWSSDGRYLVLQRERSTLDRKTATKIFQMMTQGIEPPIPPPGIATSPGAAPAARPGTMQGPSNDFTENTLVVWDMTTKTSKVIWKARKVGEKIDSWLIGSDAVYLLTSTDVPPAQPTEDANILHSVQILAIATGRVLYSTNLQPQTDLSFTAFDPKSNVMLVDQEGPNATTTWLLNAKGARTVEGIPGHYSLQGYPVGGGFVARADIKKVFRIDSATGVATPKDIKEYDEPEPKEVKFELRSQALVAKSGNNTKVSRLLVAINPKSAKGETEIVAADVGSAFGVAPGETALFYTVEGVALVRELIPVDYDLLKSAKDAAQRAAALSQAKQVGLAVIMFAADNDDIIPTGLSNDQINLYLKNDELLIGFNYKFGGGNLSEIQNPSETEMGYVLGPGGRAIIYLDGHAQWKPN